MKKQSGVAVLISHKVDLKQRLPQQERKGRKLYND